MGARAVIGTVVVVGVLVGGAYVADGFARGEAEDRVAEELRAGLDGLDETPEVTIGGFPFLTQYLAGRISTVHATAQELTVEGVPLQDVVVDLEGVTTESPITAEDAHMTAHVPLAGVLDAVDLPLEVAILDGSLTATAEVFGLPLDAVLVPRADGRSIGIDIETFTLAGATIAAEDLPAGISGQLDAIAIPLDGLPEGIELTEVVVEGDGFAVEAAGTDVVLEGATTG
ncbi:DUF2993 domain-containing protein [Actinotalea sp. C106]|uniref:LmeA family phospholipid-binding protein n=1 Tax=Actinotalea sp. C106 TaxID=2908644 RepID=UPI002027A903|nr:DUF2993 domain-containing protein [Actinotalea sp. C106]